MQLKIKSILLVSILLLVALTGVAAADEQKTKITYIAYSDAYSENEALQIASQSNDHSDLIEYTFIEYGNSTFGASPELLAAAESGFLGTQDVIFCDMMGSKTFNAYNGTINESFKHAQDNGAELYSIRTSSTPSYFDYVISGAAEPDPICTYYQAIDTTEEGIENAENLLMYLAMRTRITYIAYSDAYSENEAMQIASQSNDHSDLIEYTFIEYGNSTFGASPELLAAAESGFLGTQDIIFCDMMGSKTFNAYNGTINESFKDAQDNGAELYSIRTSSTPAYFDYVISGAAEPDPICTYYQAIDTTEEGIENAENLLMYLAMRTRITYIAYSDAYSENEAMQIASQSNDHSDLIEYTFIEYGNSTFGASPELLAAAESGFLETQDIIFCDMMGSKTFNAYNGTINESFKDAQDNGAELYSIRTSSTPSYFDYVISGAAEPDPICTYYQAIDTTEEGIENAENFLMYLAKHDDTFVETALMSTDTSTSLVEDGDLLFILGTDHNEADLINAANDTEISSSLNITILTNDNIPPADYDFSPYSLIFIESQDENVVEGWSSSINSSANVIGYNLSSNITLPNVDLYSDEYTDIERYWIQGGEANMKNMLKFMAGNSAIDEPEIVLPKANLT